MTCRTLVTRWAEKMHMNSGGPQGGTADRPCELAATFSYNKSVIFTISFVEKLFLLFCLKRYQVNQKLAPLSLDSPAFGFPPHG